MRPYWDAFQRYPLLFEVSHVSMWTTAGITRNGCWSVHWSHALRRTVKRRIFSKHGERVRFFEYPVQCGARPFHKFTRGGHALAGGTLSGSGTAKRRPIPLKNRSRTKREICSMSNVEPDALQAVRAGIDPGATRGLS